MPKKFSGENTKATEAKARKNALKKDEDERKQKEIEDEYWRDDDKNTVKKLQRKDEKDKKRSEQLEKKLELQRLADEELAQLSKTTVKAPPPPKLTRVQIETNQQNITNPNKEVNKSDKKLSEDEPLEENFNRLVFDGEVAQTVETAIELLGGGEQEIDFHPEKRMKAAYLDFEARELPRLKLEFPNLRLSQLKQMLRKDWNKSPDNPLNQKTKKIEK